MAGGAFALFRIREIWDGNRRYSLLTNRRTTNNDVGEGSLWTKVAITLENACQLSGKSSLNFS
jgi:hypothetical protein